jgi:hypothetical protein
MMKKVLVSLCVLPLLLTACSKDEVIAPVADSGKAIGFGTVLAPASRGAEVNKDKLQATGYGFRVSAYNQEHYTSWVDYLGAGLPDAPNFMNNTPVTWDGTTSAWTYDPVVYWPGKIDADNYGHVTFFAVGGFLNSVPEFEYTTDAAPQCGYTTPAAAADQKDLVVAVQSDQYWSTGKQVRFAFKHILSKIGFTAKLADNYPTATVKVTNLKVVYAAGKVRNNGLYMFNTGAVTANDGWRWAGSYPSGDSGELVADTGKVVTSTDPDNPDLLNKDDRFLMLIPQEEPATDGALTVVLTYTVTQGSMPSASYDIEYPIPAIEYQQGKQYTYNFTFTLNKVVFDTAINVSDWDGTDPQPDDITVL